MTELYQSAGGLDIHNRFIVGTIISIDGTKVQQRFNRTIEGLLSLHDWIAEHKCPVVACESTNSFWYPIYDCLSPITRVIIGNAYDMKVLTHKKTDKIDSEIIAKLALKDMVLPSHVAPRELRDFRNLMRYRHFLVSKSTDLKNRVHALLQAELFHLSEVLTDPFGVSGMAIIRGIMNGSSAEQIMVMIPDKVLKKKGAEIQELLNRKMSPSAILQLKSATDLLHSIKQEIKNVTRMALDYASEMYPREFEILCSIPGVGETTALTLLSEIGDFRSFSTGDKLAAWAGIVPKVYQSANHNVRCGITHRGSKHVRWILVQAAHSAARRKGSRFKGIYESKKDRIGVGKTIIAIARKILTIAWHLIVNDELYKEMEGGESKKRVVKAKKQITVPLTATLKEVIEVFVRAKEEMENDIGTPQKV